MNGRKSKQIRRLAECKLFEWYKSLLPPEQQGELTAKLALQYTPTVSYWTEYHEREKYTATQRHVSEGTRRYFYLQEKKHVRV